MTPPPLPGASPSVTVLIPTFKEEETIEQTVIEVCRILSALPDTPFEVIVVDDASPDRTGEIVGDLSARTPSVRLLVRDVPPTARGLSASIVDGILAARGDIIVVTDADMSHDITRIPSLVRAVAGGSDIAVGSRYMAGGRIDGWPLTRTLLSRGATLLGRAVFPRITDPVSGFFAIRRDAILPDISALSPRGYKILLEILAKTQWTGVTEIPYTFHNRTQGESKLRGHTITEYIGQWAGIVTFAMHHRRGGAWREMVAVGKFLAIGAEGIGVNTLVLYALHGIAGVDLLFAGIGAIEVSVIHNFLLNDYVTFSRDKSRRSWWQRATLFHAVSAAGMGVNLVVLEGLTYCTDVHYLVANTIGILAACVWNVLANREVTWGDSPP